MSGSEAVASRLDRPVMRPVAVLFARRDSNYKTLPGVDVWDADRDARKWTGGCPVVAHPPCRSWSVLKHFAKPREGERDLGPLAVELVRRWGGVLEHPKGSALWPHCKLPAPGERDKFGGWTKPVMQMWWGHRAEKPTMLYIVGVEPRDLPAYPILLGDAPRVLFNKRGLRSGMPGFRTECTQEEREHTPPAFAEWLVAVARRSVATQSRRQQQQEMLNKLFKGRPRPVLTPADFGAPHFPEDDAGA